MKADDLQRLVDNIQTLKDQGEVTAAQAAQLALAAGILGELDRIAETAAKLVSLFETGANVYVKEG